MKEKICFFIGHRDVSAEIYPKIAEEVEHLILEHNVKRFYVGHYGTFDSMAAKAVKEAKKQYSNVKLTMLLPYHPAIRPIEIPPGFDDSYFPEGQERVPPRVAILCANQHMVCRADYLICFVDHPSGGSREILDMALKRQESNCIRVINLSGWYPES